VLLDRVWGRNLLDLSRPDPEEVQELSREFRDILFEFPFQVPQDFIYLGRAVGMVSGLVSRLDPEINPWYYIEKYGQEVIRSREGRGFSIEAAIEAIRPYLATPARIQRLLREAEHGRLRVQTTPDREMLRRLERLDRRINQLGWSVVAAAGLVSATLLYLWANSDEEE
jgi:predicted unusual protein kinase regulating ubiquinone biosynthesis (AarF/ABC1/UbiB family)